ncbi:MAG TPA: hypothetical protein VFB58_12335 [Chloroflexota bacterium]|nr:hypothetical protein [Chloroflexota bacterium]
MHEAVSGVLWLLGLAAALTASEMLVRAVSSLGHHHGLSGTHLGILVALGADGPEVTSALIATFGGSQAIGLGVVTGSNIYNLAGLLGLAAIVASGLGTNRLQLLIDGGANVVLTLVLLVLLQLPAMHLPLSITLLGLFAVYVVVASLPRERLAEAFPESWRPRLSTHEEPSPLRHAALIAAAAVAVIVAGSELLVRTSITLGPMLHVSPPVVSDFALPVATSLPNTWAAVSLARKRMATAAVAATFNSNSINIALGVGIPGLVVALHASHAARTLDAGWLLGMTLVALALLATRRNLTAREGWLLVALYGVFAVLRLTIFA